MSFGIVRVQKMTKGSVKGIEIHDRREKNGISHTNKDIDWERSHLNYDLCEKQLDNFGAAVKQRIEQLCLNRAVRKDAIVLAQVLVTSDGAFFAGLDESQQKRFFADSYAFLCDRYGSENVISATVHLDERTPHMHFNFVPVTADGRLSAKAVLTRQSLIEQQTEFHKAVGVKYGLERGVQGSTAKHLESTEYKLQETKKTVKRYRDMADRQKGEYKAISRLVDDVGSKKDLKGAKTRKNIFTGKTKVIVPEDDYEKLQQVAEVPYATKQAQIDLESTLAKFEKSDAEKHTTALEAKNKRLESELARERRFHAAVDVVCRENTVAGGIIAGEIKRELAGTRSPSKRRNRQLQQSNEHEYDE